MPSRTSGNKILYVRHYKAEIGDEGLCTCMECIWDMEDPRMLYDVGCQGPNLCTCILCSKQPNTLKITCIKILFPYKYYVHLPHQIPTEKYNIR